MDILINLQKVLNRRPLEYTTFYIRLGRNLKRQRIAKKLGYTDFSNLSCISSYSLKKIEKGEK